MYGLKPVPFKLTHYPQTPVCAGLLDATTGGVRAGYDAIETGIAI